MIRSGRIRKTLKYLDAEYNKNIANSDPQIPVLFAKMAVLEYCGWIEEAFDEVARTCVRGKLKTSASREILEDRIGRTHGFTYAASVRPLLSVALGTIKLRALELKLSRSPDLDRLKTNLGNLNAMRKEAAHTHTSGRTQSFQSPSVIIANLNQTEPVLKRICGLVIS